MTTFEDVLSRAKAVAETAGKKTNEFVGATKVKMEIADLQREMASVYEGLGRLVYDARKTGESADEMIDACIARLDEQQERLQELEDRVLERKKAVRCAACGTVNEATAKFCNNCGEKME